MDAHFVQHDKSAVFRNDKRCSIPQSLTRPTGVIPIASEESIDSVDASRRSE